MRPFRPFLDVIIFPESIIQNRENIVITKFNIGFLLPNLTFVQIEMMLLGVLGYSRTQHAEWYDEGVLYVSGHCHLNGYLSLFRFGVKIKSMKKYAIVIYGEGTRLKYFCVWGQGNYVKK